jgi:hypothetical protein
VHIPARLMQGECWSRLLTIRGMHSSRVGVFCWPRNLAPLGLSRLSGCARAVRFFTSGRGVRDRTCRYLERAARAAMLGAEIGGQRHAQSPCWLGVVKGSSEDESLGCRDGADRRADGARRCHAVQLCAPPTLSSPSTAALGRPRACVHDGRRSDGGHRGGVGCPLKSDACGRQRGPRIQPPRCPEGASFPAPARR